MIMMKKLYNVNTHKVSITKILCIGRNQTSNQMEKKKGVFYIAEGRRQWCGSGGADSLAYKPMVFIYGRMLQSLHASVFHSMGDGF